jgi:hypothetical protein
MAFFFGDSFDLYARGADLVDYWDPASTNSDSSTFVAGRFSGSRALNIASATTLIKTSGVNDAVHHFVVSFMSTNVSGTGQGFYVGLWDGTTAQCTVVFRNDGSIQLTLGNYNGTLLATYSGAFPASNVWYAFEIEVVISNTAGSIAIRKNGNNVNDFFLGSLNTRNTANNYANQIKFGSASVALHNVDDFLWISGAPGLAWSGDLRCYVRRPVSDALAQFSRTSTQTTSQLYGATGITNAYGANVATYTQFTSAYNGLLTATSVSCTPGGGGTGHVKMALFSVAAGGGVGTVLATSNEVTNPGAAIIQFTFPTPYHLVAGQAYWLGIVQDASITYNVINSSSVPGLLAITMSTPPYASWPASNLGGVASTFNVPGAMTLYITPSANADCVSEQQQDALANYVYSSVNGQADFYNLSALAATPINIVGVTTRGLFMKTDAGTRKATVQLKSGGVTVQGPNVALNTVWGWIYRNDLVDPATGSPWTGAAVNNVTIGPLITA